MDSDDTHTAVELALAALERNRVANTEMMGAEPFLVKAVTQRNGVVAVVAQSDAMRIPVIVENHGGQWHVPRMLIGSRRQETERKALTSHTGLQEKSFNQSGWPGPDGEPPEISWLAVTGFAALDATSVVVSNELNTFEAIPDDDGFVLCLVRAKHRSRPEVLVHTTDGRAVHAGP